LIKKERRTIALQGSDFGHLELIHNTILVETIFISDEQIGSDFSL
jgi:hypothetical protein